MAHARDPERIERYEEVTEVREQNQAPATGPARTEVDDLGSAPQRPDIVTHTRTARTGTREYDARVVYDADADRRLAIRKIAQLVWFVTGLVLALISLRVVLRLIGANPDNDFARFVYDVTAVFLVPFHDLVGNPATNGTVLEVTSLIAMAVYALIAWAIVRALWLVFHNPSARRVSIHDRERHEI